MPTTRNYLASHMSRMGSIGYTGLAMPFSVVVVSVGRLHEFEEISTDGVSKVWHSESGRIVDGQ